MGDLFGEVEQIVSPFMIVMIDLLHTFRTSPVTGLSVCVCLTTILWCITLLHRMSNSSDRFLVGFIGLVAICQGLRLLREIGLWSTASGYLDGAVNLTITLLYLVAVMVLQLYTAEHSRNRMRLRLAEANEKPQGRRLSATAAGPATRKDAGPAKDGSHPKEFWQHDLPQLVLETAPVPMFAVDLEGNVRYWNPAAERVFGWERGEVVGHRLPFSAEVAARAAAEELPSGGCRLANKRGGQVDVALWSNPLFDTRGSIRGTLMVAAESAVLQRSAVI
jgi:PAS domain S-box-containing protein